MPPVSCPLKDCWYNDESTCGSIEPIRLKNLSLGGMICTSFRWPHEMEEPKHAKEK